MKRLTARFAIAILLISALISIFTACGHEHSYVDDNGLQYTSNGDGTCYVSGIGVFTDADIVIPTVSPNGEAVTGIGDEAFSWRSSLTSIVIPNSVTSISDYAFDRCTSLTSIEVDVNNAVYKSIDGNLYTKDGKILVQYATGKSNTSFVIPDSVTSIGSNAFEDCHSLTSIEIPDSVISIGDDAFSNCSSLTSIVIPDSVTGIGWRAFSSCSSLTSVVIPDSVTSIGSYAFGGCGDLQFNEYDNALYLGNENNPYLALIEAKDQQITSCNIHTDTKIIAGDAFFDCSSLTSVVIGDSVTSIGYCAFQYCSSLASVEIPDSVTSIGSYAFEDCRSLTGVVIGDSVTSIGWEAFSGCRSLKDVYYTGSEADWAKITIGYPNDDLTNATIHYNYVK